MLDLRRRGNRDEGLCSFLVVQSLNLSHNVEALLHIELIFAASWIDKSLTKELHPEFLPLILLLSCWRLCLLQNDVATLVTD